MMNASFLTCAGAVLIATLSCASETINQKRLICNAFSVVYTFPTSLN